MLRKQMKDADQSQKDLAQRFGVKKQYISHLFRDPSKLSLRVARQMGYTPLELRFVKAVDQQEASGVEKESHL